MKGSLAQIAALLDASLPGADAPFVSVSTDTRTLEAGALYVAIKGERLDGHDFVQQAAAAGATGALISRDVASDLPCIRVPDTRAALGRLASEWRRHCATPLAAITGSNGKTTVKEMLAAICAQAGPVHATKGNLNNDIGVPLTLFGLSPEDRCAVVEMGANHPGEIRDLTRIAAPDVGLITNAGPAHLEGFGSVEGVARAKGELYQHMPGDGVAVINADDDYAMLWSTLAAPRRVICFGFKAGVDVRAQARGGDWIVQLPGGDFKLALQLPGRHNVQNALAAAAAAGALGLDAGAIEAGLAGVRPVQGRLQLLQAPAGYYLIDDSYNANPASLAAGVGYLLEQGGEPWVVLGAMAELGEGTANLHRAAGEALLKGGVNRLFTVGEAARPASDAFGRRAEHFHDQQALIAALRAELHPGVTCLIKGSRSAAMERVVQALANHDHPLKRAGGGG